METGISKRVASTSSTGKSPKPNISQEMREIVEKLISEWTNYDNEDHDDADYDNSELEDDLLSNSFWYFEQSLEMEQINRYYTRPLLTTS